KSSETSWKLLSKRKGLENLEGTEKVPFKLKELLNLVVDLRSRRFAFRGRSGEPPRRKRLRGLPCPVLPQESRACSENQLGYKINNDF
ncbi:MAG: hypothetical protein ACXVNF_02160, partial [Neobacillus sp.]